ncbi:hypothetical protein BD408DRAFT_386986 [Parasitella parasitica]|nr:hypothetical protein BD408DRAFT_386986 [Parasitella parasitica]
MTSSTFILKLLALTREIVITCTFLALVYLRSMHMVYFTVSAIASTLVAKALKNVIKQPRPVPVGGMKHVKESYGMPSSHSTAISFFTSYLTCVVLVSPTIPYKYLLLIAFYCFCFSVVWSRVHLQHHTKAQVTVGTILGIILAISSFALWTCNVSKHLPLVIMQKVDMLKDMLQDERCN